MRRRLKRGEDDRRTGVGADGADIDDSVGIVDPLAAGDGWTILDKLDLIYYSTVSLVCMRTRAGV